MSNNVKKTWNTQKTPTEHVLRLFKNFWKIWFSAQKSGSRLRCRTMLKNTLKHPENTNKTCFETFWEILENPVLGSRMWFSAQISNYAKIPWNTQKTPTKHVLRLFKKFVRFSAKKSGSRPRCRTMLKILWNTQKIPTNTLWGILRNCLKIRFLAEKSGSRLRCRIMLKYHETLRKHQLNMFWGFLRNSWKSGSRLRNPILGWNIRFSAQISNFAKLPWNTQKTPTKHVLRLLKKFVKIRFSDQTSGSRLRCRTMLKVPWNSENTN